MNYFHIPAIRFLKPALKIGFGVLVAISLFHLVGLGFNVASLSAQEHIAKTNGEYRSITWGDMGVGLIWTIGFIGTIGTLLFVVAKDMDGGFAYQSDGRDNQPNGRRKWYTMSIAHSFMVIPALLPFTLMASASGNLGFMSLVFFGGAVSMFLIIPVVPLVRTLRYRAERRAVSAV